MDAHESEPNKSTVCTISVTRKQIFHPVTKDDKLKAQRTGLDKIEIYIIDWPKTNVWLNLQRHNVPRCNKLKKSSERNSKVFKQSYKKYPTRNKHKTSSERACIALTNYHSNYTVPS